MTVTFKGLLVSGATPTRLPIGGNGQVLEVSGGVPAWGPAAGAVSFHRPAPANRAFNRAGWPTTRC